MSKVRIKSHHICIQTNTYRESITFYTNVLGFTLVNETKNFHERSYNSWLQSEDFYIELQTGKRNNRLTPFSKEAEGIAHICFYVDDLKAAQKKYQKRDAVFLMKEKQVIYHVENGSLFKLRAPEGTIIEFRDNPSY